jgi:deaminated glutathione amidase
MPRLGVAQMCAGEDKDLNFSTVSRLVAEAVRQHVDLLSLPECFAFIGARPGAARDVAEPLDGPLMARYRRLARENKLWLSLGGFHESRGDDRRTSNTHVIIDDGGEVRAVYRKTHLFDVDLADGKFFESEFTLAGNELVVCKNTPIGSIGMSICYDLRFPEVYSALRHAGATVILVPSAFMPGTGLAHWEVLLRARAIETQSYVAAAAQCGSHSSYRSSYGHALVVDPWGTVVGDAGPSAECVVTVEMDKDLIDGTRSRMPVVSHRRPALYRGAVRVVP